MAVAAKIIYFDSDNVVELQNLKNTVTDSAITTAIVSAQIEESDGTLVTGTNISLLHDTGGTYRGTIPDAGTVNLTSACVYYLIVEADAGMDLRRVWKLQIKVERGE